MTANWHPDPTGQHELRYWDGRMWTEHVADRGVQSVSPLPGAPAVVQQQERDAVDYDQQDADPFADGTDAKAAEAAAATVLTEAEPTAGPETVQQEDTGQASVESADDPAESAAVVTDSDVAVDPEADEVAADEAVVEQVAAEQVAAESEAEFVGSGVVVDPGRDDAPVVDEPQGDVVAEGDGAADDPADDADRGYHGRTGLTAGRVEDTPIDPEDQLTHAVDEAAVDEPVVEEVADEVVVDDEPVHVESVEGQRAEEEPVEDEPVRDEPVEDEPVDTHDEAPVEPPIEAQPEVTDEATPHVPSADAPEVTDEPVAVAPAPAPATVDPPTAEAVEDEEPATLAATPVPAVETPPAAAPAAAPAAGISGDLIDGRFSEVDGSGVALQNSRMLRVRVGAPFMSRQGAMVAYQGDVSFAFQGGGAARFIKKAVTGEGLSLMRVEGNGDVFLADTAKHVHVLHLTDAALSVNGANVLAFSGSLDWNVERVKGGSMAAGGLFNTLLRGTGWVAITTDGEPVVLNAGEAPTFADTQAIVAWSAGLQTSLKSSMSAGALVGRGSGEAIQVAFSGQGFVIVQPSEGYPAPSQG